MLKWSKILSSEVATESSVAACLQTSNCTTFYNATLLSSGPIKCFHLLPNIQAKIPDCRWQLLTTTRLCFLKLTLISSLVPTVVCINKFSHLGHLSSYVYVFELFLYRLGLVENNCMLYLVHSFNGTFVQRVRSA